MKLTWCHNRLAVGSSNGSLEDVGLVLEQAGVTHVVNLRCAPDYQSRLQVLRGVVVLWNPAEDDGLMKSSEWFYRSIDFALSALAAPRHRVAVCCCDGNNRAPSTALAVLMAQGLSFGDAMTAVGRARPGALVRYREDALRAVNELGYA